MISNHPTGFRWDFFCPGVMTALSRQTPCMNFMEIISPIISVINILPWPKLKQIKKEGVKTAPSRQTPL